MSNLTVQNLSAPAGAGNKIQVPSPNVLYAPGHVIQVVNTKIVTPTAVSVPASYTTHTDIPSLAASITPKSATSQILVTVNWFGEFNPQTSVWNTVFNLKRNGTVISVPAGAPSTTNPCGITMATASYYASDANSTPEIAAFQYLDSPASTSALIYQVSVVAAEASTLYTNRTVGATTGVYEYGTSMITLMEIAQ
jgi:hypothetical protein